MRYEHKGGYKIVSFWGPQGLVFFLPGPLMPGPGVTWSWIKKARRMCRAKLANVARGKGFRPNENLYNYYVLKKIQLQVFLLVHLHK
mgnify:FL=1